MSLLTRKPVQSQEARPSKAKRRLRRLGVVAAGIAALLTVSTVGNAIVTASEKSDLAPYGQKVTISDGDINVYRNGGSGPTMVFLSGFGTPSPATDFAPLIRELKAFNVIVIEGFGYGYSDLNVPNRTVENITREAHEVLGKLHVTSPVILLGHSVGGIYARYYATKYPGQVSAIIGIDPMAAATTSTDVGTPSIAENVQRTLGLFRAVTAIDPQLIQPPGNAYTAEERRRIAAMTNWNYGNLSISDEWSRIGANSTKADARPFPADIPVLEFLSTDSVNTIPDWMHNHQVELAGVTTHELKVVEGAHYLQWTQAPALAANITRFVTSHVTR
jgi:pimeloyl-ACP methyl ester carboxylesterase